MSKESKIILIIAAVVAVGIVGLVGFANSNQMDAAAIMEKIVREDSHSIGDGEVQVVEFGDYQCPACGSAHPTVEKLKEEYEGDITFVYRHFPLPGHQNAMPAARAAEAAAEQDKFWEMHDKLFEGQQAWSMMVDPTEMFVTYAEDLDLDLDRFRAAMRDESVEEKINQGQSDGYDVGVTGTPTFFINGERQRSFDYDSLKHAIESELNN